MEPSFHTASDKSWKNDKGQEIPSTRITRTERLREGHIQQLYKQSLKVSKQLQELHNDFDKRCREMFLQILKDNDVKVDTRKGNITLFNFNRTCKAEMKVQESIAFDDATIVAAKAKLDEFLKKNLSNSESFIVDLVMDAFTQVRGKLDVRKVLSLLNHKQRIKDKLFHEAADLIEKSITRPTSKTYFRIARLTAGNEYEYINLNFSSL